MKTAEQKELLRKCRHKAEIPITIGAIILTILMVVLVVFLAKLSANNDWAADFLINTLGYEDTDLELVLKYGNILILILIGIQAIKLIWELFKNAGIAMVNDIPMKESYSPEIYAEYTKYCEMLGINEPPKFLLALDTENLESTGITIKSNRYLRLNAEILELTEYFGDNVVRFEVLRDLAHIAYNHYNYCLLIATVVARWLPFVRCIYNRVMCYSVDRLVAELMGKDEAITLLLQYYLAFAYEEEKRDEYIDRIKDVKLNRVERLSAVLNNLTSDTPSYLYRIKALVKDNNNGRLI